MSLVLTEENVIYDIVQEAIKKAFADFIPPKQQEINQKKFLNLQETSDLLNLSPNTIYGLTSSGKLPHIKKTRKLIFERDVLVEWLQKKN